MKTIIENKLIREKPKCLENGILKHIGDLDNDLYKCFDSRDCPYKFSQLKNNYCIALYYGYKK